MNKLGRLLREARENLSRQLGREITEGDVAAAVDSQGVPMERKTYSNLETGRTQTLKPQVANALTRVLPVSGLQLVHALGYEVDFEGVANEEEVELLEAYRAAEPGQRLAVRGALLLTLRQPLGERGRSLSRQVEMGRPDHRGIQE